MCIYCTKLYLSFEALNESKRKKEKEMIVFKECLLKSDSALLLSVFFVIIFWSLTILVTMQY